MDYITAIYFLILAQTFAVSLIDIKYKKIANSWTFFNLTLFACSLFLAPDIYYLSWKTLLPAFAFLLVGFVLFLLKVMGAGDSKYLFSLYLLIPPPWIEESFFFLLVCTMVIGGFSLFTSIVQNYEKILIHARSGYAKGIKECLGGKFPFAPVVFLSWVSLGVKLYLLK